MLGKQSARCLLASCIKMDVNRAGVCVRARTCARSLTLLWSWDFHLQPHAFPLGLSKRERKKGEAPGVPFLSSWYFQRHSSHDLSDLAECWTIHISSLGQINVCETKLKCMPDVPNFISVSSDSPAGCSFPKQVQNGGYCCRSSFSFLKMSTCLELLYMLWPESLMTAFWPRNVKAVHKKLIPHQGAFSSKKVSPPPQSPYGSLTQPGLVCFLYKCYSMSGSSMLCLCISRCVDMQVCSQTLRAGITSLGAL